MTVPLIPSFLVIPGSIELREDTVENLLSTACMLQLSEVVEACCNFLMKQLHPSNCIGIRQFADAQGCGDLYKVANNYVMVCSMVRFFMKLKALPCSLVIATFFPSQQINYKV